MNTIDLQEKISTDVKYFIFNDVQSNILVEGAKAITELGGCDAKDAHSEALLYAQLIKNNTNNPEKIAILNEYASGNLGALVFENLPLSQEDKLPNELDSLGNLEKESISIELASRSQILLALVNNHAFAYDIDNSGKIIRLVGNFNGGGINKLKNEVNSDKVNLSSHSGVSLGAHTEAPYHSTINPVGEYSPAPSTLILTARYNPKSEPTTVIPMDNFLQKLDWKTILALTLPFFSFTRSDSFVEGQGEGAKNKSLLEIDTCGNITLKFNIYRVYVEDNAPQIVKDALNILMHHVNNAKQEKITLQSTSAIAINNYQSLHCRDTIEDNRRLLIRLFGYSQNTKSIMINQDPLLVKG